MKMTLILLTMLCLWTQKSESIKVIESKENSDTGRAEIKDIQLQVISHVIGFSFISNASCFDFEGPRRVQSLSEIQDASL